MKIIFSLLFSIYLLSAQLVVVTNKNSELNTIPKEIIQYIYLAKIDKVEDIKVKPIISDDKNLHSKFCNTILCKSESQYNSYWARLVFTGRKPIAKRLGWQEVISKLKELNTIAYIDKKDLREEWKIIYEEN
ncbi:conserved hypothetical protein [Sulfurimonas denitrificans DSM 1251]|jgi:hypothetical protein|uniref:Uncharacterized protein n=1 Tax=Sulfurimonas denitrificans (strain ATCC 33889 / DSM 1251) TaxID=326298 RepID=Q30QW8_SULDN|nr:hypothetical protein [Sulfurimonas denitrificans]ABB44613.1 conserved hypothetical protein [Sulfurimonas denitrificans DSM 1251]MDD3443448.1 hypothetical protein [Sulfurimonas denitrificans]